MCKNGGIFEGLLDHAQICGKFCMFDQYSGMCQLVVFNNSIIYTLNN
jgi:hypothetical protein